MSEVVPKGRREFSWNDSVHDPDGKYTVDCRINGMPRQIFVHALPNDIKTRDATISLLHFKELGVSLLPLAIFENKESINQKVLARFSDMCEKQFSSLTENFKEISQFLHENIFG